MTRIWLGIVAAVAAAPSLIRPAMAHDVTYALRGAGDVTVEFRYQDGTPMAGATALVFAPDAGALPTVTAVTDAAGDVRLRASRDGVWRVDVRDDAGHASRARLRVTDGVASLAERAIPNWLAAASLVLNLLLGARVAVSLRRRRAGRAAAVPSANRGTLST